MGHGTYCLTHPDTTNGMFGHKLINSYFKQFLTVLFHSLPNYSLS
jgi:LPS sulfotransferase NodH